MGILDSIFGKKKKDSTTQEEIDRLYEIEKQRCEAAEKEKAEFEKNKNKVEYEAHEECVCCQ